MSPVLEEQVTVSVIVVSYNTRDWLDACLRSISTATRSIDVEIIVVDNGSADGSADAIAATFERVKLIRNQQNVGFARAVNQGAAIANGRYLLLLNPDGYLKPRAIDALVVFARRHPEYIVLGGRTVTPNGEMDPRSCWAAPTLWSLFCSAILLSTLFPGSRLFDPESMGWFARDHERPVDVVTGCLLLISLGDWRALGGFDERYFVYGEDADLCIRARKLTGRRCAITPEAEMVHAVGVSSATRPDKLELLLKGRIAFAQAHLSGGKGKVGAELIRLGVFIRAFLEKVGLGSGTSWGEVWRRRQAWRDGYQAGGIATQKVSGGLGT